MTGSPADLGHGGASGADSVVTVQILRVPDCPLVGRVRDTLRDALAHAQVRVEVVERVGAYPSPTLLVDGVDVTGQPLGVRGACCRFDLPTRQQILAALERRTSTAAPATVPTAPGTPGQGR